MEQHAEGRITHERFMSELIEGEKNGSAAAVDYEIPEVPEPLKTPDIMGTFSILHDAQEVLNSVNFKNTN